MVCFTFPVTSGLFFPFHREILLVIAMRRITGIICLAALLFSRPGMADVDQLLEKVIAAYGGREHISRVTAYQQFGVTFSSMRGVEGNIMRVYRHPDHLRVEIKYDKDYSESRILAGSRAWKQDQPVGGIFYSAMLLQAARLGLPAILVEHQQHVREADIMTGNQGETLHVLELNFHGKHKLIVGIDPVSGRILESRGIIKMTDSTMEFGTVYDDFRFQEGRLFAFKEVHYVMGRKTGYTHIQRIEIVPVLPEEMFQPSDLKDKRPDMVVMNKEVLESVVNKSGLTSTALVHSLQ